MIQIGRLPCDQPFDSRLRPGPPGALAQDFAPRACWNVPRAYPWGSTGRDSLLRRAQEKSLSGNKPGRVGEQITNQSDDLVLMGEAVHERWNLLALLELLRRHAASRHGR